MVTLLTTTYLDLWFPNCIANNNALLLVFVAYDSGLDVVRARPDSCDTVITGARARARQLWSFAPQTDWTRKNYFIKYILIVIAENKNSCFLKFLFPSARYVHAYMEDHGGHFPRRIFGRRIDLKWSGNDQIEFPRLKSQKTDFSSKNRPKKQVFLNLDQVNLLLIPLAIATKICLYNC